MVAPEALPGLGRVGRLVGGVGAEPRRAHHHPRRHVPQQLRHLEDGLFVHELITADLLLLLLLRRVVQARRRVSCRARAAAHHHAVLLLLMMPPVVLSCSGRRRMIGGPAVFAKPVPLAVVSLDSS